MEAGVKYPGITVRLVDGNAFSILGRVRTAMRRAGVTKEERDLYLAEAMSGDYDNLLRVMMEWVNVD